MIPQSICFSQVPVPNFLLSNWIPQRLLSMSCLHLASISQSAHHPAIIKIPGTLTLPLSLTSHVHFATKPLGFTITTVLLIYYEGLWIDLSISGPGPLLPAEHAWTNPWTAGLWLCYSLPQNFQGLLLVTDFQRGIPGSHNVRDYGALMFNLQ